MGSACGGAAGRADSLAAPVGCLPGLCSTPQPAGSCHLHLFVHGEFPRTLSKYCAMQGEIELLEKVLEGANVEVDESAEERKGGAGDLGVSRCVPLIMLRCALWVMLWVVLWAVRRALGCGAVVIALRICDDAICTSNRCSNCVAGCGRVWAGSGGHGGLRPLWRGTAQAAAGTRGLPSQLGTLRVPQPVPSLSPSPLTPPSPPARQDVPVGGRQAAGAAVPRAQGAGGGQERDHAGVGGGGDQGPQGRAGGDWEGLVKSGCQKV